MVYSLWSARNAIFSRIKTKRRLPHMQVKGCPYRLQRLIERLRILFLAFALLSFPRTANDNRKSPTSYDPLDCFPPPGKQVQGIFTAIPRQWNKLIQNKAFLSYSLHGSVLRFRRWSDVVLAYWAPYTPSKLFDWSVIWVRFYDEASVLFRLDFRWGNATSILSHG
jgi:hypothetical protein